SAHEFDSGPETGGMGSISGPDLALPFITRDEYYRSLKIVEGIVEAIQKKTGKPYRGMVGGQMMLTENEGPTIIEMYSRLGDPEALNILAMLKTDIIDILQAIVERRLSKLKLEFANEDAVVVKVVSPNGYRKKTGLSGTSPSALPIPGGTRESWKKNGMDPKSRQGRSFTTLAERDAWTRKAALNGPSGRLGVGTRLKP